MFYLEKPETRGFVGVYLSTVRRRLVRVGLQLVNESFYYLFLR